jgi:hypothetical protein
VQSVSFGKVQRQNVKRKILDKLSNFEFWKFQLKKAREMRRLGEMEKGGDGNR